MPFYTDDLVHFNTEQEAKSFIKDKGFEIEPGDVFCASLCLNKDGTEIIGCRKNGRRRRCNRLHNQCHSCDSKEYKPNKWFAFL